MTIPNIISREYVLGLSASELREILENASTSVISQIEQFFPVPSEKEIEDAHSVLDDGIYDSNGYLIGEKHPED
jgi:hypothetical protein